jgi:hypothetical protein
VVKLCFLDQQTVNGGFPVPPYDCHGDGSGCLSLARRVGMDRKRVDAAGQLGGKNLVDHAMTFDPALPTEGFRHDMNPEMTFTAWPMPRMTLVAVRFILHIEALRREGGGELFGDPGSNLHERLPKRMAGSGQPDANDASFDASLGKTFCQDLKVNAAPSHNVRS